MQKTTSKPKIRPAVSRLRPIRTGRSSALSHSEKRRTAMDEVLGICPESVLCSAEELRRRSRVFRHHAGFNISCGFAKFNTPVEKIKTANYFGQAAAYALSRRSI